MAAARIIGDFLNIMLDIIFFLS